MSSTLSSESVLTTDLSPHLALITGATGGIGQATALALAKQGCAIAVHYNSAAADADSLVAVLQSLRPPVNAAAFQADLGSYDETRRLFDAVVTRMGRVPSILFNNAGLTAGKSGVSDIRDVSIEDFERTWRTNCASGYLLAQLCIPPMADAGWGRVIFCSSVAAFTGGGVGPHYASSKSAIHGLVHWLASRYADRGVTVNGVAPALIEDTKMLDAAVVDQLKHRIPVGRLGRAEEVAEMVLLMVKTPYITNKVFGVDGGMFIQ